VLLSLITVLFRWAKRMPIGEDRGRARGRKEARSEEEQAEVVV